MLMLLLLASGIGLIAMPGTALAANPTTFSTLLTNNPRAFTLTGTDCSAKVGFIYDNEASWQRIGGVTVTCTKQHAISATSVVQYTTSQYTGLSKSAYYSPAGVSLANATSPTVTTFKNAYGFNGKILFSSGVCRGGASYSIFYTGTTVTVDGARYALTSWGYWDPTGGC